MQVLATDPDGDVIAYSIRDVHQIAFTVESQTGWINVISPLNRTIQAQLMIQILATDDGYLLPQLSPVPKFHFYIRRYHPHLSS